MKKFLITIAIAAAVATAQNANFTSDEMAAHQQKIEKSIADRDYTSWKAEHDAFKGANTRLDGKVNSENFDKFAQMVEARKSGDMTKAQQLRTELGIEPGMGRGQGKGGGQGMRQGQGMRGGKGGQGNCNGTGSGMQRRQGKQ
jgi:hypothetical protein